MALPQIGLQSYVMTQCNEVDARTKNMALFGAMNSFGMIVGPLATSLLLFGGLLFPMWIAVASLGLLSIALGIVLHKNNNLQPNLANQQQEKNKIELKTLSNTIFFFIDLQF